MPRPGATITLNCGSGGGNFSGAASTIVGSFGGGVGGGGTMTVQGGQAGTSGSGGIAALLGGTGVAGAGGQATVTGGTPGTNQAGGSASLAGADGNGTGNGGNVAITAGAAAGSTGTPGAITMSVQGLSHRMEGVIFAQTAAATLANSAARTSIIGTGLGTLTLPANFLVAGRTIRIHMAGIYSCQATAGNETVDFSVAGVAVATSAVGTVFGTAAETAQGWVADFEMTCVTAGAGGTAFAQGLAHFGMSTFVDQVCGITAASTFAIDTTASKAINVNFTWGTAVAANTITTQVCTVEALN